MTGMETPVKVKMERKKPDREGRAEPATDMLPEPSTRRPPGPPDPTRPCGVYLKGAREEQLKYLVPMRHPDVSGFPQTYIEPQEFDILRMKLSNLGENFANAGTICRTNVISGSYHSFDADLESELVQRVLGERISEMRKMLGT